MSLTLLAEYVQDRLNLAGLQEWNARVQGNSVVVAGCEDGGTAAVRAVFVRCSDGLYALSYEGPNGGWVLEPHVGPLSAMMDCYMKGMR